MFVNFSQYTSFGLFTKLCISNESHNYVKRQIMYAMILVGGFDTY